MTRSACSRFVRAAVIATLSAGAVFGTAGVALAGPAVGAVLQPGGQVCTPAQFAGHKLRLNADATGGGTTVVLLRDGVVITRVTGAHQITLGVPGPGPLVAGTYQGCSTNAGTTQTVAQLQLFTDSEVR
jgi:hypothetical protein